MKRSLPRLFIFFRCFTLLVALIAVFFMHRNINFNLIKINFRMEEIFSMWSNFDGVHYTNIAAQGYENSSTQYTEAFFPIYPLLIRFLNTIFNNYFLSGLIISNTSLFLALYFLVKLISLDHKKDFAFRTLKLILFFPTAFYLVSIYSESLFFLLTVLSFYSARKGHWVVASLFALFSSATRLVGIFLFPALLLEYFLVNKKNLSCFLNPKSWVIFLSPIGLLVYMLYLKELVGDPLYFIHVQPIFNSARQVNSVILFPQVVFRYLKIALTVNPLSYPFLIAMFELASGLIFFILSLLSLRIRPSYGVYSFLAFLLPTLTGTFSSIPRYVLVLFPCFILLNIFFNHHPRLRTLYYFISIPLLVFFTVMYTSGYFVS